MQRLIATALAAVLGLAASTQAATILIDIGLGNNETPGASGWNNASALAAVVALNDTTGAPTGATAAFAGWSGANGQGAQAVTTPAYPASAYSDSFFLNAGATGTVTFTALDPNLTYTFTLLASRGSGGATNTRAGEYTLAGATSSMVVINATTPTDTGNLNAVNAGTFSPNGANTITLSVTPQAGSPFAYLNIIQIDTAPLPEPASLGLIAAGAAMLIGRRTKR